MNSKLDAFFALLLFLGILAFPVILVSAFFLPVKIVSILLSVDALIVSVANLKLQLKYRKEQ